MLRLFYKDLTGEVLPGPDEHYLGSRSKYYGEEVASDDLKYLELLVNKYHLNPRPRLILFVEGQGEFEQFQRLAKELLGKTFSRSRVQVQNLEGVGKFTGEKKDKYGALARFIDSFHNMQTIVFVVLDNEGRAGRVKRQLVNKTSQYYPRRTITRDDYVHIWDRTVEFDNYTHDEIAKAMTEISGEKGSGYDFTGREIEDCERLFDKRVADPLSNLFSEKCKYRLSKRKLLHVLTDYVLTDPEGEFDESGNGKRPVVRLIQRILALASKNNQPTSFNLWKRNQESGYFGRILE